MPHAPIDPNPVQRPRAPIALRIPATALAELLRLDPTEHTITGATIRRFGQLELVELSIDAPNAPPGAVEMLPDYHHNGRPDPVSLVSVTWLDINGGKTVQPLGPTLPALPAAEPSGD